MEMEFYGAFIQNAFRRGYLYGSNEVDFLQNIMWDLNSLTEKQEHWFRLILRRIFNQIVVRPDLVAADQFLRIQEFEEDMFW